MKSIAIPLFASAMALATMAISCNKTSDNGASLPVEFQDYKCESVTASVDTETKDTLYMVNKREAMLPVHVGDNDIKVLKDSLLKLASVQMEGKKMIPSPDEEFNIPVKMDPKQLENSSSSSSSLSVTYFTPDIIVWQAINAYYLEGAAHGMYTTEYLNYDINGNKILSLADLLKPESLAAVTKQVRTELKNPDSGAFADQAESAELPANFYILNDTLVLVYQPYEVGPFAAGVIRVELQGYEIQDYLTPLGLKLMKMD